MTKEDKILAVLSRLEDSNSRLELQFTNHLEHHREDLIRKEARIHRYIMVAIPLSVTTVLTLIAAAYFLAKS